MRSRRIHNHIRANVIGYVALFFSLSLGTAWALERNSVRSKHIVNGQVKGKDTKKSQVQARVDETCAAGRSIRAIAEDGSVSCEVDDVGGGGGAPTGPAGGGLRGTYPNPLIADDAVFSSTVLDNSLSAFDLASNSVGTDEIANNSVNAADLGPVVTRFGAINIGSGNEDTVTASCLAGEELLGGGGGPAANPPGPNQIFLTDSQRLGTSNTWTVTAWNTSGSTATVVAEVNCLTG